MSFKRNLTGFAIAIVLTSSARATTLTLGQATGFNVFTFSDFTPTGADTLGKVAVGGNFTGSNYLVGSALHSSPSTLDFIVAGSLTDNNFSGTGGGIYVGGNATLYGASTGNLYVNGNLSTNNGSLTVASAAVNGNINAGSGGLSNSGNIYTKGAFTASYANSTIYYGTTYSGPGWASHAQYSIASNPLAVPANPIDFLSAKTSLASLSSSIQSTASNGNVSVSGNGGLTLNGSSATQNVFSISVAQLNTAMSSSSNGITINVPAGSVVLVNVTGTTAVNLAGNTLTVNGTGAGNVLFNFSQTTSITYGNVGLTASMLAPSAAFNGTGGNLNGTLIANTVTGVTEFHNDYLFTSAINVDGGAATPEPSTLLLGAAVLLVAALCPVKPERPTSSATSPRRPKTSAR